MTSFVTGGTGLVGSWLICKLLQMGRKVKASYRKTSSFANFNFVKELNHISEEQLLLLEWVEVDLLDISQLENSLCNCDIIYHCAAIVSFNEKDYESLMKINVEGTANIVNIALSLNIKKIIYVSSIAAIGTHTNKSLNINEDVEWVNESSNSNYSKSKHKAEMEVWRGVEEGLNAIIVNPGIINGPAQWNIGFGKSYTNIYNGLKYYSGGKTGFVDVRDVINIIFLLEQNNIYNERFILVSENIYYKDAFNLIADGLNKNRPKYLIGKNLAELAWRVFGLISFITGKDPIVTKETARAANNIKIYSSEKICSLLKYKFIPINESISYCCQSFIKFNSK